MRDSLRLIRQPKVDRPSLLVGWESDAGKLGPTVIARVNTALAAQCFCEIDPAAYYPMIGVAIEDNVARFPESRFYCGRRVDVVTFAGGEPRNDHYGFLGAILDVAERCGARQIITIGGLAAGVPHDGPRRMMGVYTDADVRRRLAGRGLEDMTWQGPAAFSSYLLWAAARRGIAAASVWVETPFYLVACRDLQAVKAVLGFFGRALALTVRPRGLSERITRQNHRIDVLRKRDQSVDEGIASVERGLSLDERDRLELAQKVAAALAGQDPND